jgi:hypothetical protein
MPGLITSASQARSLETQTLSAFLDVLDQRGENRDTNFATLAFQHYPATISVTNPPGWTSRDVGLSHPLVGWGGGGGRSVTFTAEFTADEDLTIGTAGAFTNGGRFGVRPGVSERRARYSPDIRAALAWLTTFTKPEKLLDGGLLPPRRLRLTLEGCGLGRMGSDTLEVIVDDLSSELDAFFASGVPRTMSCPLTFREHIQAGEEVNTHTIEDYAFVFMGPIPSTNPLYHITPRR